MLKSTGGRARAIVLQNQHMVVAVQIDQKEQLQLVAMQGGGNCNGDYLNMLSNHRIIFVLNIRPSIKTMHYYFIH